MTRLFEIDDQTTEGKKLIEFLSSLKFVKTVSTDRWDFSGIISTIQVDLILRWESMEFSFK